MPIPRNNRCICADCAVSDRSRMSTGDIVVLVTIAVFIGCVLGALYELDCSVQADRVPAQYAPMDAQRQAIAAEHNMPLPTATTETGR